MMRPYAVHVYPDRCTDGTECWVAEHPALPGCTAWDDTAELAKLRLDQARAAYLRHLTDHGQPVPPVDTVGLEWTSYGPTW